MAAGKNGLLDIKPVIDISIGDVVEIRSSNSVVMRVTYRKEKGHGIIQIGDVKGRIQKGDSLYKLSDSKQLQNARESYSTIGKRSQGVGMYFYADIGQPARLQAYCDEYSVSVETDIPVEKAEKKALTEESVIKQLKKTGISGYHPDEIRVFLGQGSFVAVSRINALRRKALAMLAEEMSKGRDVYVHTESIEAACKRVEKNIADTSLEDLIEKLPSGDDVYTLPPITYGKIDVHMEENLNQLPEKVLVENLGWIMELVASGRRVYGGAGLNVMNHKALQAIEGLGVKVVDISPELKENPRRLMITQYPLKEGIITDRKGQKYVIARDETSGKTEITKKTKKLSKNVR